MEIATVWNTRWKCAPKGQEHFLEESVEWNPQASPGALGWMDPKTSPGCNIHHQRRYRSCCPPPASSITHYSRKAEGQSSHSVEYYSAPKKEGNPDTCYNMGEP